MSVHAQMDSIEIKKYQIEQDKIWDSICTAETQLALEEIKLGKLTYVIPKGMVEMYDSDKELNQLLKKYKIKTTPQGIFCTVPYEKQFCYGDLMNKEIEKLYGSNFIEKKREEAEKIYITKNIYKIFPGNECDRNHSIYPLAKNVDEYIDRYRGDYFKDFTYPANYIHRKEGELYSHTDIEFILTRKGKIKNLKVHSTFHNPYNQKFAKEFEEKAKYFIQNISWIPNKKSEIIVKSKETLTFLYDKDDK
jgi:hypothetical protein